MRKAHLVLAIGLALAAAAAAQAPESKYIADTVTVQADAVYEADPDLATLTFDVSATDKQLRKAYDQATASLQRILALAERNGLARQDVTTGAFTVTPDIDWRDKKRRPRSYRVESRVTFRLRDFSRLGDLIDEAVDSGIAEFRSLDFSLENEEDAKVRAVAMARERAEARARAALGNGSRLGPVRFVGVDIKPVERLMNLNGRDLLDLRPGVVGKRMEGDAIPAASVSPEKIRVRATVNCVFQIVTEGKTSSGG